MAKGKVKFGSTTQRGLDFYLVAIGEQRTMETARMIYEQHLDRYFGED